MYSRSQKWKMEGEKIKMIWRLLWLMEYFNESLTPPDMSLCVCVCVRSGKSIFTRMSCFWYSINIPFCIHRSTKQALIKIHLKAEWMNLAIVIFRKNNIRCCFGFEDDSNTMTQMDFRHLGFSSFFVESFYKTIVKLINDSNGIVNICSN